MNSVKKIFVVAGVCASLFALAASGETSGTSDTGKSGTDQSSGGQTNAPDDDVVISKCSTDSLGSPEAQVKITNHSSKASNYMVEIAFESSDGSTQIDTSFVSVNNLQPGQSSIEKAVSFSDAPSDYVCKVTDVTRYAS